MHRVGSFVIFLIENFDPVKKSNYSSLVFEVRYDNVCKRMYYAFFVTLLIENVDPVKKIEKSNYSSFILLPITLKIGDE